MDALHVQPAPGLVVRDPATRAPLPPEGAELTDSTYWQRRLIDGDVILVQTPPEQAPKTPQRSKQP